jgi:hypothetical protein
MDDYIEPIQILDNKIVLTLRMSYIVLGGQEALLKIW